MKNFRIYQYRWGLCLAERLPGREIRSKLHFLRVKWEMPAVYSKSFRSQLTSTSPVYLQASVASWAGESVTMSSLRRGGNVWFPSRRVWHLSLSVFAERIQTDGLLMGKQSFGDALIISRLFWEALVHCGVVNDFLVNTSPPTNATQLPRKNKTKNTTAN